MSTKKSTSGGKSKTPPNQDSSSSAAKKRKSTGFIETSGYKPNWLETGPLDPSMLPDPMLEDDSPLSADEFEALQQSLQGFYRQEALEHPEDAPAEQAHEATPPAELSEPVVEEAPIEEVTFAEPEEPQPAETPHEIPEPDEWVQPLLADEVTSDAPAGLHPVGAVLPAIGDDVFLDPLPEPEPVMAEGLMDAATEIGDSDPAVASPRRRRAVNSGPRKRRDRLGITLFLLSLLLLGAAALFYYVNPFSRLALGAASLARPVETPRAESPRAGSGNWCVRGDFQSADASPLVLADGGDGGDLLATDGIFSIDHRIAQPGAYEWQVIDCENPDLLFPPAPAWVKTTAADETVTFTFDSQERADPLFFPIAYVVSATDAADEFQVVGSFQEWNPDDPSGRLDQINIGLYQQVRRIARAGNYEGYIIADDRRQAIDAYGRTTEPIPFSFETDRNGDYVVFLVDTDRGRASVIYDMPSLLSSLSYGRGHLILSLSLAGLSLALLVGLLARYLVLHNRRLQLETGCPRCGRPELMRIARRPSDRFLHRFGIPAYRYRCRHCTWEGMRLSESGETVSPGISTARFSDV